VRTDDARTRDVAPQGSAVATGGAIGRVAVPGAPSDNDAFTGVHSADADRPAQGTAATVIHPAQIELIDRRRVDVPSASGLVALGQERFLVVDDDKGIYLSTPSEGSEKIVSSKHHKELKDLERIAMSPDRSAVFVVEETAGRVFRLALDDDGDDDVALGDPVEIGRLPKLNRPGRNDGWEGLDILPGRFSADGKERMVAVHEGNPRRVGVFTLPNLEEGMLLKLPNKAKDKLDDLSDVAVDPQTGRIFLLSDQSAALVEVELVSRVTNAPGALLQDNELRFVDAHKVPRKKKEKPEGITFDDEGTLWLTMDGRSRLLEFEVTRPGPDD
jgi:uncharacterized protein YjiK